MSDHLSEIDAAILEIDRARKLLAKVHTPQVRNAEHRDFLKATALSWFRTHRTCVIAIVPSDLVEAVDQPYRRALDASERHSAKSTFVKAFDEAKRALVAARGATLVVASTNSSLDDPPDFSPLASDATMRTILERRWHECLRCKNAGAPLAATVMMGGFLEALFVARANKLVDKGVLFSTNKTPLDSKTKKALDLRDWTLAPYIDVGHALGWISRSAKDVAAILRDYRNYVHPEKERSHGISLTEDDASMFWEVAKSLSRELLALKGSR